MIQYSTSQQGIEPKTKTPYPEPKPETPYQEAKPENPISPYQEPKPEITYSEPKPETPYPEPEPETPYPEPEQKINSQEPNSETPYATPKSKTPNKSDKYEHKIINQDIRFNEGKNTYSVVNLHEGPITLIFLTKQTIWFYRVPQSMFGVFLSKSSRVTIGHTLKQTEIITFDI